MNHRKNDYKQPRARSGGLRIPAAARGLAIVFACAMPLMSIAQTATDTEEQRRRAQQEAAERAARQAAPEVRLQPQVTAAEVSGFDLPTETPCFPIRQIQLDDDTRRFGWLSDDLAGYAGRCIGHQGINRILQRASGQLIERGFVTTRIGVPEQDLAKGILRLVLVPGVIRAIRFADDTPERTWRSAFPARPGDLLNLRDIEQGLEQMKRVPSQDVSIDIVPGETPGESDLVLTVKNAKPWRLGFSLDDAGAKTTGRRQASLSASLDNPLGLNDLLSISLNNDAEIASGQRGTRGHSLQYSIPWGNWTLFLMDGYSHYLQTVQGINQRFHSSGDAYNQEIKVQRLVYRDQRAKSSVQFRLIGRETHSFIEDTEIQTQRRRTTAAEIGLVHRQYLGKAQLDLTLAHRQGVSWLGGQSDTPERDAASPTFAYRMQILDATLLAPFEIGSQSLRWISTLRAQTTRDTLYAADYIAIGNRYTVRGFDGSATLAADRGGYFRNEIEIPFAASGMAAYAGIDYGRVGGAGAANLAGRSLTGAVVGLRGMNRGFGYDLFVGGALRKPDAMANDRPVAGFNLSYQF